MTTIKKIFSQQLDEEVHSDFVKFSKGVFDNRYLIEAKKQKDKFSIKTGPEFANYFVKECLSKVKGEIEVKGVIVATFHIPADSGIPIARVKQFMGVKQSVVESKVNPENIIKLMEKYPKAFFALSFSTPESDLKIKAKAPKSAKPASGGEKAPAAEFCSLKTNDHKIISDLFFDIPSFQEVKIRHSIIIDGITLPKGVTDPVKIREMAKRKGKVKRIIDLDGKEQTKEANFEI